MFSTSSTKKKHMKPPNCRKKHNVDLDALVKSGKLIF